MQMRSEFVCALAAKVLAFGHVTQRSLAAKRDALPRRSMNVAERQRTGKLLWPAKVTLALRPAGDAAPRNGTTARWVQRWRFGFSMLLCVNKHEVSWIEPPSERDAACTS